MKMQYSREYLLSFAEKQECKRVPTDLDPALRRDSPSPDIVDGGSKFVSRRDHELPEWRRGPPANGGGGGLLPPRRKNFEEEGSHPRGPHWESRNRLGQQSKWDRDRERGGPGSQCEGSEPDAVPRHRFGWNGSEHDGLLGSGGGLRGPFPGGRGTDRYNGGGRGMRNNESRLNKPGASRDSSAIDGETFGEKVSTENRAEEERKRREDFEAMRRGLKGLKEKQKEDNENKKNDEDKENNIADSVGSLSDSKQDTASKVAVASIPRPSVPPGFSGKLKKENSEEQAFPEKTVQQGTVDPLAIACSISGGDVSELAEDPRIRVIDKLFSKTIIGGTATSSFPLEKADTQTSKFAHLFSVEDEISMYNSSGSSPRSPVATMSETKKPSSEVGTMLPMPDGPLLEDIERTFEGETEKAATVVPLSERVGKPVLTCEDVEQSFLAEAKIDVSTEERIQGGSSWKQEVVPDNNASRHLLSMLQKPSLRTDNERIASVEEQVFREDRGNADNGVATLESLFGTSFMKELRSTDAPLSAKAVSDTSTAVKSAQLPPGMVEFQPTQSTLLSDGLDYNRQAWPSLWNNKPEKQRDHIPAHMMSLDEVERSFLENTLRLRQTENGDGGRLTDHAAPSMFDTGVEFRGNKNQQEELESGVLSDFLKFKNRKKGNDSFLDGMTESSIEVASGGINVSTPAALFRSHSPPSINRTNPLQQLHQLQQVLATKTTKQFQHNAVMGDAFPDDRYGRLSHARPSFSRQQQQQQQAMYEQIHSHFVPPQGFPPQLSSKQRSPSYFVPNGSNQPVHMVHGPGGVPSMNYGHHPPFGPGFVGPFAPPNEVFVPGGEHAAAASMDNINNTTTNNNNRWTAGRDHVGVPGLYQQPMYGMNKLGFP